MKVRGVKLITCLTLLCGMVSGLAGAQLAFAAEETDTQPVESIDLNSEYPVVNGESGDSFEYVVVFDYKNDSEEEEEKVFDISLSEPEGWEATVKKQYGDMSENIRAMRLNPNMPYPDRLKITLKPLPGIEPEPGEYTLTVEAASGDVTGAIDLKAVVTEIPPDPRLKLITTSGMLNTTVNAGEDNVVTLELTSTGTGPVEDISFTSNKAEGWGITYDPSSIDSLEPGQSQEVEVTITPPGRTIAGDYSVTLTARGSGNAFDNVALRASVQTSTTWGGAGIAIIAAVITGLVFLFRKLGRR